MRKIILSIVILAYLSLDLSAQTEAPDGLELKSQSVSLNLIGAPSWPIGVSYSQLLNERLSIEIGLGLLSAGAGLDYYLTKPRLRRLNFTVGVYGSINIDGFPMVYVPIGISYLSQRNMQYHLSLGPLYADNVGVSENGGSLSPWFGLKIGRRFGTDLKIRRGLKNSPLKNMVFLKLGLLDPWLGFAYERLISPHLGIEAAIGFLGISAGPNFYFPAITPGQLGFKSGLIHSFTLNPFDSGIKAYIPLGVHYQFKNRIVMSFDAGPQFLYDNIDVSPIFNLKVGMAF